jgi:undecaprenyl-diphosphatase
LPRFRFPARQDWLLIALAGATLVLTWLFVHFGSEVMEGELRAMDLAVRDWVMAHGRLPRPVLLAMTVFGAKEFLVPVTLLGGWFLFRQRVAGILVLLFCALASSEFVKLLKEHYQVYRPEGGFRASTHFSFPSGHASLAAAICFLLAFVAVRRRLRPAIAVSVATVIVLMVGYSRIALDMHWTSDVLGGWVIGTAFGIGCGAVYELIERRSRVA